MATSNVGVTDYAFDDLAIEKANLADNAWLQRLLRFTREWVSLAAGRFPVCAPLLRGPFAAAIAMRGALHFVMEFLDDPAGAGAGSPALCGALRDTAGGCESFASKHMTPRGFEPLSPG